MAGLFAHILHAGQGPAPRRRRTLAVLAVAAFLAGLAAVWALGSRLIAPAPARVGPPPAELEAKELVIPSTSGSRLAAWLVPGRAGRGAVLLAHANGADRRSLLGRARFLRQAGYALLLFDFQAHGESPGAHKTFGWLEARDAQAALGYLRTQLPGEAVAVIGISLGGAAALLGGLAQNADALVLEAVYPTFPEAVANRLALRLGAPARLLAPLLLWQLPPRLGLDPEQLAPQAHMGAIRAPLLLIAGSADPRTRPDESRRLFALAPQPKELWVIDGAAHEDFHAFDPPAYEARVLDFLARHLWRPQPGT